MRNIKKQYGYDLNEQIGEVLTYTDLRVINRPLPEFSKGSFLKNNGSARLKMVLACHVGSSW